MKQRAIYGKIAAFALIIFVLSGCQGAQPQLEPTVDAKPTFAAIQTQAVQTAIAQMTLLAPTGAPPLATEAPVEQAPTVAMPTEAPTVAPTAAPTFTALPPTAIPTNTFVPRTATPFATATSSAYSCSIVEASPAFGYDMRAGGDFDGRWEVKNIGTETWKASDVDIKYISGTEFQTRVDALDLWTDVAKNSTLPIVIDMLAPNDPGRYSAVWAITRGGSTICTLPITIDVQ